MHLLRKLLVAGLCGVAFMAGVAGLGLTVEGVRAGTIALFTGPAGSNPALAPQNLADYNAIINGINGNAAFAGTSTPSQVIGAQNVASTLFSLTGGNGIAFVNSANWTSTTGIAASCGVPGAFGCLYVIDNNGKVRGIPTGN